MERDRRRSHIVHLPRPHSVSDPVRHRAVRIWRPVARAIQHFGDHASQTLARVALFASSIYGGYLGAGPGIILLAMVQVMGFATFHMANRLKNLLAARFTIPSIGVFGILLSGVYFYRMGNA